MTKDQERKIYWIDNLIGWCVMLCMFCAFMGFFWEMMHNYDLANRWFYACIFFFVNVYIALFTGIWVGRPKR